MAGRIKRSEQKHNKSSLPIIGKLKVGEKSKKGIPRSLDYFKATGKYAEHFNREFDKPSKIPIIFINDDIQTVCPERLELRDNSGRLFGYGDGHTFHIYSRKEQEYKTITVDEMSDVKEKAWQKSNSKKGWEEVLTLRFIIPEITGIAGLWQLTTKAKKSSVPHIRDAFDYVLETAGTVVMMPFDIEVKKVKSQRPDVKYKFPVINLIPNVNEENMNTVKNYLESGHDVKEIPQLLNSNEQKALEGEVHTDDAFDYETKQP